MVPLRPAALFRSRWSALFWAAGVLWFASDVAGRSPPAPDANTAAPANGSGNDAVVDDSSLDALQNQVHAFEAMK